MTLQIDRPHRRASPKTSRFAARALLCALLSIAATSGACGGGPEWTENASAAPSIPTPPLPPLALTEQLDLPYGSLPRQRFDLRAPSDYLSRDYPIFMLIHGGGWAWGDKSEELYVRAAQRIARLGFVVATPNYALSPCPAPACLDKPGPKAPFPAAPEDIAMMDRFMRSNRKQFGRAQGAPAALSIGGYSAGAHLAFFQARSLPARQSYACAIDIAGPVDLADPAFNPDMKTLIDWFLNGQPAELASALPNGPLSIGHAFILHAKDDPLVPWAHAEKLAERLKLTNPGTPRELRLFETGGHPPSEEDLFEVLDQALPAHCR